DGDKAAVIERWRTKLNPLVRAALVAAKLTSNAAVAETYGKLLKSVYDQSKGKTPSRDQQQLLDVVAGKQSPGYFPKAQTNLYMSRGEKDAWNGLRTQFDKIAVKMANAPPRAMVLVDADDLTEPKIFVRGNAAVPGEPV